MNLAHHIVSNVFIDVFSIINIKCIQCISLPRKVKYYFKLSCGTGISPLRKFPSFFKENVARTTSEKADMVNNVEHLQLHGWNRPYMVARRI